MPTPQRPFLVRAARSAALALALVAASGCGKPIIVHAVTESAGDPIADVRVYRHRFGFFNFFPGKKFVETGPDGRKTETATPLQFVEARMINRLNPKTNSEEEVPVITLLNTADNLKIELTQGEVKDSPYSLATLVDTRSGGKEVALRTGQQFELDPGQSYKLVDVSEEAATIQDLASGERLSIPRLEINATPQPPTEP